VFTIIGYAVVFGAVIGGFVLEGGPIAVLNQTVEFLIIGGAAIGSLLAGTPTKVLVALANSLKKTISGSGYSKADYMELFNIAVRSLLRDA
jgi:chemotaxis protein MotA